MVKKMKSAKKLLAVTLAIMIAFTMTPLFGNSTFADSKTAGLSLELMSDGNTFVEGDPVYIKASGDPGAANESWVGLYKKGEVPGSGVYSLRWFYVGMHEDEQINIIDKTWEGDRSGAITPGDYQIMLFADSGYTILKTIDITITKNPDKEPGNPSDELSLKLVNPDKTTYKLGEEVKIVATGIAEGAWVGLFKESETPATSTPSLRWFYINDGYNGVKVDIMSNEFVHNNKNPITEGNYKILLYDADNYDNLITTINIKIEGIIDIDPDNFSIESDKTSYAYKENIRVKASGTGISNAAWVGLYTAETTKYTGSYLYYYYVRESNGTWTIIQNRTKGTAAGQYIGDGKYKLVIFADGGYDYPVKSVEIQVIRELKYSKVIRDPGCTTLGIEYVTYEDDTSEYRDIPTLGGHIWGDPIKIDGIAKHKYVCERNEDHIKTEACTSSKKGTVLKAATVSNVGRIEYVCDVCGDIFTETISKIKEVPTISASRLVYNGKTQKPSVNKIVDSEGKTISGMYTITYPSSSYKVGSYNVLIKFKDNYAGSYKLKYKILPKSVTFKKIKKDKKAFTATWSRAKAQATGYQIAYSQNGSFKEVKYKKVKGIKKTSAKVSKLKGNKKYYVKVRAYKIVSGKNYYSAWSKVKTVKTEK